MRIISQIALSLIFGSVLLTTTTVMAETNILSFTNPSIVDIASGNVVNPVTVGQQYTIRTDFVNPQTIEQKFMYTVHITNVVDNTESINAMLEGVFAPGEEFTTSLAWEPADCGDFVADFAVYDNLQDKNSLAEPLRMPISVEGCPSEITPLDAFFQNIQNFFAELFT